MKWWNEENCNERNKNRLENEKDVNWNGGYEMKWGRKCR